MCVCVCVCVCVSVCVCVIEAIVYFECSMVNASHGYRYTFLNF